MSVSHNQQPTKWEWKELFTRQKSHKYYKIIIFFGCFRARDNKQTRGFCNGKDKRKAASRKRQRNWRWWEWESLKFVLEITLSDIVTSENDKMTKEAPFNIIIIISRGQILSIVLRSKDDWRLKKILTMN